MDARKIVASLAIQYIRKEISYDHFMDAVSKYEGKDLRIDRLVDMIEHEPKRGVLLGISETEYKHYAEKIITEINLMIKDY